MKGGLSKSIHTCMFEVLDFYYGISAFGEEEYLFGDTSYSVRRFWSFLESPRFFYIPTLFAHRVILFFLRALGVLCYFFRAVFGGLFLYRVFNSWN